MDQVKIGKFIAQMRKNKNLTQRQLADSLSISDKTVSKWECGKGIPEVSLMLPLCNLLNISVNDLLSGESVPKNNYQNKAEENIIILMKENEENRKKMILSFIFGGITIIAVVALVMIASFVALPTVARIAIIFFAFITAAIGIAALCTIDIKAGYFECPYCKVLFIPTMLEYVKGYHTITKRRLTCPKCKNTGMCKHRIIRKLND